MKKTIIISILMLFFQQLFAKDSVLPKNYETKLSSMSLNWFEKKVNISVIKAVTTKKVVLDQISDYLFLQVIPNDEYKGEKGEQKLGEDLMSAIETIQTNTNTVIQSFVYANLLKMKLPFKRRLIDKMVISSTVFVSDKIDLTFFADINKITARIREAMLRIDDFTPIYNSKNKFYRMKKRGSKLIYFVRIPNIIYEMIFTGRTIENILKNRIDEITFLGKFIDKFEQRIEKTKELSFDGRYIRGKKVFIDLYFLYKNTNGDIKAANQIMKDAFLNKKTEVRG